MQSSSHMTMKPGTYKAMKSSNQYNTTYIPSRPQNTNNSNQVQNMSVKRTFTQF